MFVYVIHIKCALLFFKNTRSRDLVFHMPNNAMIQKYNLDKNCYVTVPDEKMWMKGAWVKTSPALVY